MWGWNSDEWTEHQIKDSGIKNQIYWFSFSKREKSTEFSDQMYGFYPFPLFKVFDEQAH